MVYVPAGSFDMGSTDAEVDSAVQLCNQYYGNCTRAAFENEKPRHHVTLSAFWIDRTEVTAAQYAVFLNQVGNQTSNGQPWLDLEDDAVTIMQSEGYFAPRSGYAAHPATQVSWDGAQAYCQFMGGRLPTEAEWEYAARGPKNLTYPWGDGFAPAPLNFCDKRCGLGHADTSFDDGYVQTAPVGGYARGASWCGALDMAGNVWEWVADWYQEDAYTFTTPQDPTGPDSGQRKSLRGGSWFDIPSFTRGANRYWDEPTDPDLVFGFRCVVTNTIEAIRSSSPTETSPSCEEVSGAFASIWRSMHDDLGCAADPEIQSAVVEERFQKGTMYWREAVDLAQALAG
jgi:formylglycine-generating enzyme required for sulfatase activity